MDTTPTANTRKYRRERRLAIAERLSTSLNSGRLKNERRIASEKPRMKGAGEGYVRSTITARRPVGQVTLYWHGRSRTFKVKVSGRPAPMLDTPHILDDWAEVSGMVGRCACGGCGKFFAKADPRMVFCTPECANKDRQRRSRSRARARRPAARIAFEQGELAKQQRALDIEATRAASDYRADENERVRELMARQQQQRDQRGIRPRQY
jgi:hypothetical protein